MQASVVVPTHGGAHRLPDLLAALAKQDFTGEWELVIVVDGVVDDSAQVVARWADRLPVRVVVHQSSVGVVEALNGAFSQARGSVLIRCDDDLTPGPDFVRRHVAHHGERTDIGVIGPTRDVFPNTPYSVAYGRSATERSLAAAYARAADQRWVGWAANNSLHRDAWACSGGFDPRFVYGQDSELGWRLAHLCGVTLVVDPALQVDHRGPSTSASTRIPRAYVSGASKRLFYLVHPEEHPEQPRPHGMRARTWTSVVGGFSSLVTSKRGFERVGKAVDRLLVVLPISTGASVVALCVEAAGRSGMRHGSDDLAVYKAQKATERLHELLRGVR